MFRKVEEKPYIADANLKRAFDGSLDKDVAPPVCPPLIGEVDHSISGWLAEPGSTQRIKLIVLPPCDRSGIIAGWASDHGHETLAPPRRDFLMNPGVGDFPEIALGDGDALLVVPELERWFLRHRNGLDTIRHLISELHRSERRCLIGCNSWAWAFLVAATGVDLALPQPVTFQSFDGERLGEWFNYLDKRSEGGATTFRLASSGKDVLGSGEGKGDGGKKSDFLVRLASRSLGIPWIAWHLWRRGLRSDLSLEAEESTKIDAKHIPHAKEKTLWIVDSKELKLPSGHEQDSLFTLHALLIHGGLTVEELRAVLPTVGGRFIVAGLVKSGFVEQRNDVLVCSPSAYPTIRAKLSTGGFPVDSL